MSLEINVVAVALQAATFVLFVLILKKLFWGSIASVLDARRKEVQDTLEQVASDRKAMELTRSDYERRLANIEAEAREHISGAVKQAQAEAAAILAKAKDEAGEQRERALAEINQERKKALAEIRSEMADLAVLAAGKVLERELNPAAHRELVRDFIQDVAARS